MNIGRFCLLLGPAILICFPAASRGITLGQVDTFEDGTQEGWITKTFIVNPVKPPFGTGNNDHYLDALITFGADGTGPLQMDNQSQWTGNYLSAGVTGIAMDLFNNGGPSYSIRIAIREGISGSSLPGYCSTIAFSVPNDNLWHHAVFSLAPQNLTGINSPKPLATDLANVIDLCILNAASPAMTGDNITIGGLGIDNITAVPEPSSISILLSGIIGVALLRRRKTKR